MPFPGHRVPRRDNEQDLGAKKRRWRTGYFGTDVRVNGGLWDDLRFPAQGINPPGLSSDPTVDTDTGMLLFAGDKDNVIAGAAQMPHAWLECTAINPHMHLVFPTLAAAKATRWKFEYEIASVLGSFTAGYGSYGSSDTITVANPNDIDLHVIAPFAEVDMSAYNVSAVILWRVSRLALSDAADNDTTETVFLEFDIHYQNDSFGSVQEYVKT